MSTFVGFEACEKELRRIINETRTSMRAAQSVSEDEVARVRMEAGDKLIEFTENSRPKDFDDAVEASQIDRLDDLAINLMRDLNAAGVSEAVGRIMERTAELNQLSKSIRKEIAHNETRARSIRLTGIKEAIDSMSELINAAKNAKDVLDPSVTDEAMVRTRIERLVKSFSDLQKAVSVLG